VILAVDQGTTGTTCLVVDGELRVLGRGYRELTQSFPQPGWVEHDPEEIWRSVVDAAGDAVRDAGAVASDLDAIGIANQRETVVLWERRTGRPVAPAIVWQDRRTADRCRELPFELIRERTGLVPDPYFSATKLEWLLGAHELDQRSLAFGTVDSFLLWRLTGGRVHATDATNASRTALLDIFLMFWVVAASSTSSRPHSFSFDHDIGQSPHWRLKWLTLRNFMTSAPN
jgi:glycerol kinase